MTEQEINPEQQINRVLLSGRLARDPELLDLPNGTPVCLLRLACAGTGRRVVGGSRDARAGHVDVIVLGAKARRIARYLYGGRGVVVQGSLETERWEAGEGPEREAMCVLAERVHFAGNAQRGAQARALASRSRARDAALGMSAAVGFSEHVWG
jgi:single-strand DNA-binding protein